MRSRRWLRSFGVGLALVSGTAALALLLLPLMLVLRMVLFDSTAHGVLVLLGVLLGWLQDFLLAGAAGGSLAPFPAIAFHPLRVAAGSIACAAPCAAGLLVLLARWPARGSWWWVVLLWSIAALLGGKAAAAALLPGLLVAGLFASGIAEPRA